MHILIADDEAVARRLLQAHLQQWGYEVAAAQNGAEAWDLFEKGTYPVVITDWMMPELDGLLSSRVNVTSTSIPPSMVHDHVVSLPS